MTLPPWLVKTVRPVAWKRSTTACRDSGSKPGTSRAGQLRDDAGHPAAPVGRALDGAPRRLRGRGDLLAQDCRFQRAQVGRRLDAEPVDERPVRVAVGGERVGLAARAVEGEHQLAAQPLAQRVLLDQPLELARDLGVPAAREVGLDALADAAQPQVFEPRDLGLGEALGGDVRERRPAPKLERLAQRRRRLPRLAAGELLAPEPEALLEAVGVEPAWGKSHGVAAAL